MTDTIEHPTTLPSTDLSTESRDAALNRTILAGDLLGALDAFYADTCVMQEGLNPPREGKATNRAYEEQFVGAIAEVHAVELHSSAVNGDVSFSEWTFDMSLKDGSRATSRQVAVRQWSEGHVHHERFFSVSPS